MRGFFYAFSALVVIGLAYWAYFENYKTQDALRTATTLQRDIGAARERLNVLEAEWAYLNRPERLRDLASLNYEYLQLMPITPDQFGNVGEVALPQPESEIILENITGAMDVQGADDSEEGQL